MAGTKDANTSSVQEFARALNEELNFLVKFLVTLI